MSIVLEIHDLLIHRDQRQVVSIEHLSVEEGQVLAVIGPNGAGKSSLLLALAHLLQPAGGQITFSGRHPHIHESQTHIRRRMSLVLQEPLLLDLSVYENVAIGLRFRRLPHAEIQSRVDTWLARFGINHLRKRSGMKLSGGEARRVSLARAFALQPELLLLDEPFNGLDAPTRGRLLDDLRSILRETATTSIFITHDLAEARHLGDRLAVLLEGRLRQYGSPAEVFAHPADDEVRSFLCLNPPLS